MPKLPNVTNTELSSLTALAEDLNAQMQEFVNKVEKGYVDRLSDPLTAAWDFSILARSAADMSVRLLMIDKMQKQKDEIERLKAQR